MHSRLKFDIGWRALLWAAAGPPVSAVQLQHAHARLRAAFPSGVMVTALSVRTLLDALLGDLALPSGSWVLMSGVNIQNMADIVQAHGLRIRAVDIDLDRLAPAPGELLRAQAASW